MKTTFLIVLILLNYYVSAQINSIQKVLIIIVNEKQTALENATVELLKSKDSSLVKSTITDKNGLAEFEKVIPGTYIVKASVTNYASQYSDSFNVTLQQSSVEVPTISLLPRSLQMREVVVSGRKPFIQKLTDRIVVNVDNSIVNTGSSAMDVLERSPGVIVNRQANSISMNGKDGVMVMINGKINYMPGSALVQMLAGMNAGNIDRIELITTPPSNLDAQGNAGFINIMLISNPDFGFNGSVSATMGYGRGEAPAASVNFNYRKDKINFFGDYSFAIDKRRPSITNYRRVLKQGDVLESYTANERFPTRLVHNARLGLDYQVNKSTVVGILVSAYMNRYSMHETITNRNYKNSRPDT